MKDAVCIGMVGAGRATELHMNALKWVGNVPVRLKRIAARREEQVGAAREKYGFEHASLRFEDLLDDPDIDVIDICTPSYLHEEMTLKALAAGKHVICEKPLTGYFGNEGDPEPIGGAVSKSMMYDSVLASAGRLRDAVAASGRLFMYAENFVYAPAVLRAAEIIRRRKSRILLMKGEESVNGSSSKVAGEWRKSGGGAFMRVGCHPLTAALWLKQQEAKARGTSIGVRSVIADMARATEKLTGYERRHLATPAHDVEDQGTVIVAFTDDSRAVLTASDTRLGGSWNAMELYCNDAVISCTLTMSNLMETFLPDEEGLDGFSLSELLPRKAGWNKPSVADGFIRGYVNEMQDFMEAVCFGKEPRSGVALAYETIRVLYAAYASAETGRRVSLAANQNVKA